MKHQEAAQNLLNNQISHPLIENFPSLINSMMGGGRDFGM